MLQQWRTVELNMPHVPCPAVSMHNVHDSHVKHTGMLCHLRVVLGMTGCSTMDAP